MIVDAHCHVSPYWFEPVEALLHHMDSTDVDRALLVQYHGQFDNSYQHECVMKWPDRFASVVMVDPTSNRAVDELERLVAAGAKGLRLRPTVRSPGGDPLSIWKKAAQLQVPVTTGSPDIDHIASEEFEALVQALPDLKIVIEHLGSRNSPDGEPAPYKKRRTVFSLSRFPNVYMKFHGLGEIAERNTPMTNPFPFQDNVPPILNLAIEAFGTKRMMWGSDWPPVSRREGYRNSLEFPREILSMRLDETDIDQLFGETARSVYGWG